MIQTVKYYETYLKHIKTKINVRIADKWGSGSTGSAFGPESAINNSFRAGEE